MKKTMLITYLLMPSQSLNSSSHSVPLPPSFLNLFYFILFFFQDVMHYGIFFWVVLVSCPPNSLCSLGPSHWQDSTRKLKFLCSCSAAQQQLKYCCVIIFFSQSQNIASCQSLWQKKVLDFCPR